MNIFIAAILKYLSCASAKLHFSGPTGRGLLGRGNNIVLVVQVCVCVMLSRYLELLCLRYFLLLISGLDFVRWIFHFLVPFSLSGSYVSCCRVPNRECFYRPVDGRKNGDELGRKAIGKN